MAQAPSPEATVHPGRIQAIFDHLILGLKTDPEAPEPGFLLSHWSFRWSAEGLTGNLAYLQAPIDGTLRRLVLSDSLALADRHASRLAPRGWLPADMESPVVLARFERSDDWPDTVHERVSGAALELVVAWSQLAPPVFAQGPAPRAPEQDIVSVLIEAAEARAAVDGRRAAGSPFNNDIWIPWLGRSLSSCLVALGEVLLTRPVAPE